MKEILKSEKGLQEDRRMDSLELHVHLKETEFAKSSYERYGGGVGCTEWGRYGAHMKRRVVDVWRGCFSDAFELDLPILTPESVYKKSGHVERFTDPVAVSGEILYRADHLVESLGEEWTDDLEKMERLINESDTEKDGEPFRIRYESLMFKTQERYMRPELAQQIVLASEQIDCYLPFAVSSVGEAFRREISCKPFLRLAQFTLAEIEHMYDEIPDEQHDLSGTVFLSNTGSESEPEHPLIRRYIKKTVTFLKRLGFHNNEYRFRQHGSHELSHYASDCWDLEIRVHGKWLECAGFADRGVFDFTRHGITLRKRLDKPVIVEDVKIKPNRKALYETFKDRCKQIEKSLSDGDFTLGDHLYVDEEQIPENCYKKIVKKRETLEQHVVPKIVEPSFGIDRICYAVLANRVYRREKDEKRVVTSIPPYMSYYTVAVAQLINSDKMMRKSAELADLMIQNGVRVQTDRSSTTIGKRYVRTDRLGIPYVVTGEGRSIDGSSVFTVRERDSAEQIDVYLPDVKSVETLCSMLKKGCSLDEMVQLSPPTKASQ